MLADDEGIVIEGLRFIIEKHFGDKCIVEHASTGRSVIELADKMKPDIGIMDIQMPGINGIDAMKEIRKTNPTIEFIVMTAYDKFIYAQESIHLRVLEYLTKPVNHKKLVEVLQKAMKNIDDQRNKRSDELMIREKLEIVIPMIESNFVYAAISGDDLLGNNFSELLGMKDKYGMMMVLELGDSLEEGNLTNPIGVSVKAQRHYSTIRDSIKSEFQCIVGSLMMNKIAIFVPRQELELGYEERSLMIDKSRRMMKEISRRTDMQGKIGIGSVVILQKLHESYKEAISAERNSKGRVAHVRDLPIGCNYEENYPIHIEDAIFLMIEKGDMDETRLQANLFYDWMLEYHYENEMDIKLKVLEFILLAEQKAFLNGGMTYYFRYRKDYLETIIKIKDYESLRTWYLDKLLDACKNINTKKEEQTTSLIERAKKYIEDNYSKDISLDDVSKYVDITSYYFSKLFKEEVGENFIEYLTKLRIDRGKLLLKQKDLSIKQIGIDAGYSDPNYFSRIFKRYVGVTPTEYREMI